MNSEEVELSKLNVRKYTETWGVKLFLVESCSFDFF